MEATSRRRKTSPHDWAMALRCTVRRGAKHTEPGAAVEELRSSTGLAATATGAGQLHDFLRNFPNRFLAGVMRADFPGRRAIPQRVTARCKLPSRANLVKCATVCHSSTHTRARQTWVASEALVLSQNAEPIKNGSRRGGKPAR